MYSAIIESEAFDQLALGDRHDLVMALANALVNINAAYLDKVPNTPLLYESGVTYHNQPGEQHPGQLDRWRDIPRLIQAGYGACEDLAAWRVAELNAGGETGARIGVITQQSPVDGSVMYHVVVIRANGQPEDPSALLGMGTPAAAADIF